MSNISRRDFMKTAGVMTLAVAASAALAGCDEAASSSDSGTAKVTKDTYYAGETAYFGEANHSFTASADFYSVYDDADAAEPKVTEDTCYLYALVKMTIKAGYQDSNIHSYYAYNEYAKTITTNERELDGSFAIDVAGNKKEEISAGTDDEPAAVLKKAGVKASDLATESDLTKLTSVAKTVIDVNGESETVLVKIPCNKAHISSKHSYGTKLTVTLKNKYYPETAKGIKFEFALPSEFGTRVNLA